MPQTPTCTDIRIRNVRDAQTILYACYEGHLPIIKSRLDSGDRHALAPGNVYAWEERGSRSTESSGVGIERFTEGKRWTPSRLREDFLYYYEKYLHLSESDQKVLPPPADWDPFIKQTYSAWITTPKGDRKWHLTAYYTDSIRDVLKTIDDVPLLKNIVIPEGYFRSNADVKLKKADDATPFEAPFRTYAPFPSPWSSNIATSPSPSVEPQDSADSATPPPSDSTVNLYTRAAQHSYSMDKFPMTDTETPYLDSAYPPAHLALYYRTPRSLPPSDIQSIPNLPPAIDPFDDSPANTPNLVGMPHSDYTGLSVIEGSQLIPHFSSFHDTNETPGLVTSDKLQEPNSKGPRSVGLAPLHSVLRHHPYRRDPLDDRALRLLGSPA